MPFFLYIYLTMDPKTTRTFMVLKGLLLGLLGLVFIAWPGEVASGLAFWIGFLLLTVGLVSAIYTYRVNKLVEFKIWSYLVPLSAVTGGLIFLLFPRFTLSIFALIIGIWILLEGIQQVRLAGTIETMGKGPGNWMLILGIVSLILGLVIIFKPFELVEAVTIFFGILMLISGVFMISTGIKGR